MRVLTDAEIDSLLNSRKRLPADWQSRLAPRAKAGLAFRQRQIDVLDDEGRHFQLIVRSSDLNILDFSVILAWVEPRARQHYRLIRHNGRHPSLHTNKLEKAAGAPDSAFRDKFHIHRATKR